MAIGQSAYGFGTGFAYSLRDALMQRQQQRQQQETLEQAMMRQDAIRQENREFQLEQREIGALTNLAATGKAPNTVFGRLDELTGITGYGSTLHEMGKADIKQKEEQEKWAREQEAEQRKVWGRAEEAEKRGEKARARVEIEEFETETETEAANKFISAIDPIINGIWSGEIKTRAEASRGIDDIAAGIIDLPSDLRGKAKQKIRDVFKAKAAEERAEKGLRISARRAPAAAETPGARRFEDFRKMFSKEYETRITAEKKRITDDPFIGPEQKPAALSAVEADVRNSLINKYRGIYPVETEMLFGPVAAPGAGQPAPAGAGIELPTFVEPVPLVKGGTQAEWDEYRARIEEFVISILEDDATAREDVIVKILQDAGVEKNEASRRVKSAKRKMKPKKKLIRGIKERPGAGGIF